MASNVDRELEQEWFVALHAIEVPAQAECIERRAKNIVAVTRVYGKRRAQVAFGAHRPADHALMVAVGLDIECRIDARPLAAKLWIGADGVLGAKQTKGLCMINTLYKRGRIWWLKYRLQGEDTKAACVSLNTSDKQVAEKRRSDLVNELERERAGIISPKEMREAACRDVSELVGEFVQDLRARGRAEKYASNLETRLKTLASECGWKLLRDATADSFVSWRSRQTELKAKTLNEYLNAACGLLNWLQRNGRMVANPLKVVGKVEMRGVETRQRRGLTEDELRQLIAVSGSRKAVYLVAAFTGLRRGELEQLEWSDVHIDDCPEAFIEARASTTKNHKKATIKLHSDVVSALREWKTANGGKSERVFRVPKIETFRGDLKRAGIVYKDAQGRFADFHSPACHPLYKSTAGGRS